nr:hypothetical protein [Bradyrhizobium prioritasuperba]
MRFYTAVGKDRRSLCHRHNTLAKCPDVDTALGTLHVESHRASRDGYSDDLLGMRHVKFDLGSLALLHQYWLSMLACGNPQILRVAIEISPDDPTERDPSDKVRIVRLDTLEPAQPDYLIVRQKICHSFTFRSHGNRISKPYVHLSAAQPL